MTEFKWLLFTLFVIPGSNNGENILKATHMVIN